MHTVHSICWIQSTDIWKGSPKSLDGMVTLLSDDGDDVQKIKTVKMMMFVMGLSWRPRSALKWLTLLMLYRAPACPLCRDINATLMLYAVGGKNQEQHSSFKIQQLQCMQTHTHSCSLRYNYWPWWDGSVVADVIPNVITWGINIKNCCHSLNY